MRGSLRNRKASVVSLLAVAAVVVCAQAFAWPWSKKDKAPIKLKEVMKAPQEYLNREVTFKCRFALRGKLFKSLNTRFNRNEHANFAVWGMNSKLWDKAERRNVLPTLYIDKSIGKSFDVLRTLKRYDVIEVTGEVVNTYAGLPWLLVSEIRKVEEPSEAMNDATVVHIRQGLDLLDEGKSSIAARHFEMAFAGGVPESHKAFALGKLGKAYSESGEYAKAAEKLAEAVELEKDDADLYIELAEVRLNSGDYDGVIASCEKALKLTADNSRVHALMGEAYGKQGKFDEAIAQCDIAGNIIGISSKDKAMVEVRRARVQVSAKRYADAVRSYAYTISDVSPLADKPWLRREIASLYESRYDATGREELLDEAAKEYRNANNLEKPTSAGLLNIARVEYKRAKAGKKSSIAKARATLQQIGKLDGHYIPAIVLEAKLYLVEGNKDEAKKIIEALMNNGGRTPETLIVLADLYIEMKDTAGARKAYSTLLEIDPNNIAGLLKHAQLCETLGDKTAAMGSYSRLFEIDPKDKGVAMKLGMLQFEAEDFAAAAASFAAAEGAPGMQGDASVIMKGRSLALAGDTAAAEKAYRYLLQTSPENVEAMGRLAMLLTNKGKKGREALELAAKAYDKNLGNPVYADILGWAQLGAGEVENAEKTIEGIPADKRDRLVWYHLAYVKYSAGKYQDAMAACDKALSPKQDGEISAVYNSITEKAKALLEEVKKASERAEAEAAVEAKRQAELAEIEAARAAAAQEAALEKAKQLEFDGVTDESGEKIDEVAPADNETPASAPEGIIQAENDATDELPAPPPLKMEEDTVKPLTMREEQKKVDAETNEELIGSVDVPGIMDYEAGEDFATLKGPQEKMASNNVNNLPVAEEPVIADKVEVEEDIEPLTATPPLPSIDDEELPAALAPVIVEEKSESVKASGLEAESEVVEQVETVAPVAPVAEEVEPALPSIPLATEKKEIAPVEVPAKTEAPVELPKNNIEDLPDWAR